MASPDIPQRSAQKTRILAPDVARGVALLGIALANVATAWLSPPADVPAGGLGGMLEQSIPEQIAVVFGAMFVHVRGLPMFTTLLGYGVGMIALSLWRRQYPVGKARAVLLRRYGLLALFGLVHMAFIFWGDIMFMYGVAGILIALMVTFSDRALWWIAGILGFLHIVGSLLVLTVPADLAGTGFSLGDVPTDSYPDYLKLSLMMVAAQVASTPAQQVMLLPLAILGFLAARHRVLSRVDEFRRTLWSAVGVALAVILLVGLPWGLAEIGMLPAHWAATFAVLNQAFGPLTGPGIVAAIALAVQPLQNRLNDAAADGGSVSVPLPVRMFAALGARSMSGYVGQNILFLLITQSFTLGIGQGTGILGASAVAVGVWLITLFLAFAREHRGRPGHFEMLHRYLSYGRAGLQDPFIPERQDLAPYRELPGASVAPEKEQRP